MHMSAYLLARQAKDRLRPADLLRSLQSSSAPHESNVRLSSDFPLVPKSNFASLPPPQVVQNTVPEAEIRADCQIPWLSSSNFREFASSRVRQPAEGIAPPRAADCGRASAKARSTTFLRTGPCPRVAEGGRRGRS